MTEGALRAEPAALSLPLVERLEANLAGRYEDITGQEGSRVPKYGATWAPLRAILFRGSYSEGYRSPGLTENRRPTTTSTSTVNDPLRGNTPTPCVRAWKIGLPVTS